MGKWGPVATAHVGRGARRSQGSTQGGTPSLNSRSRLLGNCGPSKKICCFLARSRADHEITRKVVRRKGPAWCGPVGARPRTSCRQPRPPQPVGGRLVATGAWRVGRGHKVELSFWRGHAPILVHRLATAHVRRQPQVQEGRLRVTR